MSSQYHVNVEVCTTADSVDWPELSCLARSYVRVQASRRLAEGHRPPFRPGTLISLREAPSLLTDAFASLRVCDISFPLDYAWTNLETVDFGMRLYRLNYTDTPTSPRRCGRADDGRHVPPIWSSAGIGYGDAEEIPAFTVTPLPHVSLEGQWESLYYGESEEASIAFKRDIVAYVDTAMRFASAKVDPNFITWNRLLLFYGPPGTGKTSFCKALAQKLSIRFAESIYPRACLLDINAHSLFSRWFSESGKQVLQLFEQVHRLAADKECLVCCVMDEVESLAAARASAMKGNEPSDSIRVVNALLTQIDRLQRHENILVLATTNLTGAIDEALLDRADKRVHVPPPGPQARYRMLLASVQELLEKGLLNSQDAPPLPTENGSEKAGWGPVSPTRSSQNGMTVNSRSNGPAMFHSPHFVDEEANPDISSHINAEVSLPEDQLQTHLRAASYAPLPQGQQLVKVLANTSSFSVSKRDVPSTLTTAEVLFPLLQHIADWCAGLNGRTLKKLPFLAYGLCATGPAGTHLGTHRSHRPGSLPLRAFLMNLGNVAKEAAETAEVPSL